MFAGISQAAWLRPSGSLVPDFEPCNSRSTRTWTTEKTHSIESCAKCELQCSCVVRLPTASHVERAE